MMPDTKLNHDECFVREPILLNTPAPDFEADAYHRGDRVRVRLSDYLGSYVILFFYTADFTFV